MLARHFVNADDLPKAVANEVTRMQPNLTAIEVYSDEYQQLGNLLTNLPFRPIRSHAPALAGTTLIGGGHSWLRTKPAARLSLIDRHGNPQTLYQSPYRAKYFGDTPHHPALVVLSRGKQVQLWQEGGLLFALTAPPKES